MRKIRMCWTMVCFMLLLFNNLFAHFYQTNNAATKDTTKPPGGTKYTYSGRIQDVTSGEQLVAVSVWSPEFKVGTTSNNYGYFSITLSTANANLQFSSLGYQVLDTILKASNESTNINLVRNNKNELAEVVVKASRIPRIQNTSQMGAINIPVSQIQSMPKFFGEADVMKTLQMLPGVQQGTEGTSALIVRGGSPDQNLIILDDAPLYNPSHLLGIFSAFNTNALKNVDLFKSAFPARYGGRLSSVIDITMKDGNLKKIHGNFSVGLLASSLTLEGPIIKDKTSFIVSARRSYLDLFTKVSSDASLTLYFMDLNAKVHHKFSDKDHLYISAYAGKDVFGVKTSDNNTATSEKSASNDNINWGNKTLTARWNHIFNKKTFVNTAFIVSQYKFAASDKSEVSSASLLTSSYNSTSSSILDFTGKIDVDYRPIPGHNIRTGISVTQHTFTPGSTSVLQSENNAPLKDENTITQIKATEIDAYIEDDWKITDKLKANIGLHASAFSVQGKFYSSLQPRISARYLLANDWAIKASYSQMTQYLHLLASNSISLPTDLWVPATKRVAPQQATQYSIGVAKSLHNNSIELSSEIYYKKMNNVIEYKEGASFLAGARNKNWEDNITVGKGESYGWETMLQKKAGRTSGWIAYTLAWSNRKFSAINFGQSFPYKYDRRHNFNLVLIHKITPSIEFSAAFIYQSPTALTVPLTNYERVSDASPQANNQNNTQVELIGQRNNIRVQATHRLDVGVSFIKEKKNGNVRTWNVSVYNVYNRKNLSYYSLKSFEGSNAVLSGVSLLPLLPSVSYNLTF